MIFPEIGRGGTRTVYALSDEVVVKVPNSRNGQKDNLREYAIWTQCKDYVRKYLVPVIDCDPKGDWLLMPKGEPIQASERPGMPHFSLRDWRKVANWVRLGDQILLCDYAQGYTIRKLNICLDV
jgi:hypothetical protein